MNLHEYQGKEILAGYGVRIQRGKVAQTPSEAVEVAKQLTAETGTSWYVVKAQVHAGGRGKGGGVKLAKGIDKVETNPELIENTAIQQMWKDYKPIKHKERSTFKKVL